VRRSLAAGCAIAGGGCDAGSVVAEFHDDAPLEAPLGPIGVQKQEHSNLIFFVECPRFMALATGGGGRFCQGRAFVARSSQRSGDPLQVLPPLPSPLPEAGALDEERNSVHFLIAVRT
jgi:hypothetical protein